MRTADREAPQHPSLCSYHNLRHPQHTTSQSVLPDYAVPWLQTLLAGPLIADAWTQLHATPCGACSETLTLQQACLPVLVLPCQYHSTNAPHSHFITYHRRDITPSASLKKIIMNTTHRSSDQKGQCLQHLNGSDSTRLRAFSTAELSSYQQIRKVSLKGLHLLPSQLALPPVTVNQIMPSHVLVTTGLLPGQ